MKRIAILLLTILQMLFLSGCLTVSDFISPASETRINGVWIATVCNIDFPSSDKLDASSLIGQIDDIVARCAAYGLTDLFLQVRSCSDAMYRSELFPSSTYAVPEQGDALPIDILEEFVVRAHACGMRVHAWLNPYRISMPTTDKNVGWGTGSLAADNPARLYPECVVRHSYISGGNSVYALYYDPGHPKTVELILDGAEEILQKYDVDGIHIDDYFYPYGDAANFADNASYTAYGQGKNRDDWRRENVNTLVRELFALTRAYKVSFGVSPGGIWAKQSAANPDGIPGLGNTMQTYYDVYADSLCWVQNGWVDYICPQIYWDSEHSAAPFETIAAWWDEKCAAANVDLYVGIAAYKGADSISAFASPNEIPAQLTFLNSLTACQGVVYYSYRSLRGNFANVQQSMKIFELEPK